MTKPPNCDWRMLPDLIFSDVMMKIVLKSFESLHRCRQVCKNWNERILSNIWESPSKREIIKTKIEKTWEDVFLWLESRGILRTDKIASLVKKFSSLRGFRELQQITCAASLAHHGYIRFIEDLKLERLDLSSIPANNLASLVSCVTPQMWYIW